MSNHFSKIAIPAAIAATIALSFGAALAQSQQTGTQPTQAQPGQSSGAATDQPNTGTNSMPMQGMEHGHMMVSDVHVPFAKIWRDGLQRVGATDCKSVDQRVANL